MTVRARTNDEKIKQRDGRQSAEVFAIPRVPNVIYTAILATVPSTTDMVALIEVMDGSGTVANILPDMKMLVGTSAGADDIGFCRVRATPTLLDGVGEIKIGEESHIDWQESCHLTIVDDYDILPRHLRIVAGEAYIDHEVDYTNQHTDFDPIVNMGGHRVFELTGSTVSHVRSAATSQVFDGTISAYLWEAPGSSSVTNGTTATATIEYDTPGHYVEYLTLTSNDGKTWTGVRYVFIVDPANLTGNIQKPRISESADGVTASFEMVENAALTDFKHRSFVILFARDYYGGVRESIGYVQYEENILASGRISNERVAWTDDGGVVQFTLKDWKYWMGKISSFPFGLERANSTAAAWTDMTGLNVDRATWVLLHEYCTVTRICDFHPSGDTRYAEELSSTSNNLAAQLNEITMISIFADLVFDRFGSAWLRMEPQLVPESDRAAWVTVMTIETADYQEGLSVEPNVHEENSQVNVSGVSVSQYGVGNPHFSLSYGRIPSPYGDLFTGTNALLSSQEQSNTLAGLMMGWNNRLFDSVTYRFTGNIRMFSVAEYCRATTTILASSNPRGIAYSGNLIPRRIDYEFDDKTGFMNTVVEFQDESEEQISVIGDFPAETGIEDIDFSMPPMPKISIPPIAAIPMPADITNANQPKKIVMATSQGMFFTENFDETPEWKTMNSGLEPGQLTTIEQFVVTPSKTMYILTEWTLGRGFLRLMGCSGIGGAWSQKLHADSYPYQPENSGLWGMGVDQFKSDQIALLAGRGWSWSTDGNVGESRMAFVNIGGAGFTGKLQDYSHRYKGALARAGGRWYVACAQGSGIMGNVASSAVLITNESGGLSDAFLVTGSPGSTKGIVPVGMQEKAMMWDDGGTPGYNMIVTAASQSTSIDPWNPYGVAFSPNGENGMGASGITHVPYKTSDGGSTWQSVAGVIPNGFDVWENCGDNNRFIFAGGTEIRLTMDNGATYLNKAGNLPIIAPLVDIHAVRFIE